MKDSDPKELREKLIGLGKTSMRKNYYAELLKEKQKLELQNRQLLQEVTQRREAEAALQALNNELEDRIRERTRDLERLNRELAASYAELQQAHDYLLQSEKLAALGSLVAGISHEVNTPLGICLTSATFLNGLLETLRHQFLSKSLTAGSFDSLSAESLESAGILINNLRRSIELLDNFKMIAVDQTHYEYRQFLVMEYTRRILSNLQPELKKKAPVIELTGDEDLTIKGYPGILTQLLTNLVMNSLIHGFSGEGPHRIRIAYATDAHSILMDYSDNGIGMTPQEARKAFDPFYTTKRGAGGSGLGLFIVFNLITARLRGSISLETQPGSGVLFRIRVPLQHRLSEVDIEALSPPVTV